MARSREHVVNIWVPLGDGNGGGFLGGAGAMFALFAAVVGAAVLVLVAVVVLFPSTQYSSTTSPTRTPGPCEPFCSLRTSAVAPGGVR